MRLGLRGKYILFISVLLTVFSITFTVIGIMAKERAIRARLEEKARAMASLLAASAVDPLALLRIEDLRLLLDDVLNQEEVVYAHIFNERGMIVTDGSHWGETSLRFTMPDDPVIQKVLGSDAGHLEFGPNVLEVAEPVTLEDHKLGGVRIGYSLEKMHEEIASLRNRNILLGLCFLAAGIGFALILVRRLTGSLDKLMVVTEAASNGDLGRKIKIDSGDELEALANAFNTMTKRLNESKAELQTAHDELEDRVRDEVAEHEKTQNQLIRVQRLNALGQMSAGISHNLNNILTGIVGPAQLLAMDTKDPKLLGYVSMIRNCTDRAVSLIDRLYMAVRRKEEILEPIELNPIVVETLETTQPRWKDESEANGLTVRILTSLGDIPAVAGTSSGVHDIVMNLLFNAVESMPEGGTIRITTETVNGSVRLVVCDTGHGMNKEILERVFEPFFTTKADVGTGLGLSTVYGAVNRWGGTIDVESSPGEGATFTVCLPIWEGTYGEEKSDFKPTSSRRGRLLVLDDEDVVCEFLTTILSEDHEVKTVLAAEEALGEFTAGEHDVALIDLGMPGIPGDQVAEKMRQIDPALVTVLITGWRLEDDDNRLAQFDLQLQKPFKDVILVCDMVGRAIQLHDERVSGEGGVAE